jgi:hypothetical protein
MWLLVNACASVAIMTGTLGCASLVSAPHQNKVHNGNGQPQQRNLQGRFASEACDVSACLH